MYLSKRLTKVASFVTPGSRVADVGCDHGYVPIWLVEHGIAPSAIAADVKKGPLSRAEAHIRERGLEEKIETRLSDGLSRICPGEAQSLIISGIGGLLLIRLLTQERETAHSFRELILSPQSDQDLVRRFLVKDGYTVHREAVLEEDGKYYFILYVTPKQDNRIWAEEEYAYGKEYEPDSRRAAGEFLKIQIRKLDAVRSQLLETAPDERERIEELEHRLELAVRKKLRIQ